MFNSWARRAFTLVELLVVVAIIGVLIALILPGIQQVREAAMRSQCLNNLRQIGFALHGFLDTHDVFPASGWTTAGPGNPGGKYVGWRPLTLPYYEQRSVHDLYDFNANWWEGANLTAATVQLKLFQCSSVPQRMTVLSAVAKPPRPAMTFPHPVAPTDYEAIMGVQPSNINPHGPSVTYTSANRFSVMSRNSQTKMGEVRDGTSTTIMVVECAGRPLIWRLRVPRQDLPGNDQGICWADSEGPFSLDGSNADGSVEGGPAAGSIYGMNKRNDNEPFSFHQGGCNFLFADGHVQFLRETMPLLTLAALCTMNAGEAVELP